MSGIASDVLLVLYPAFQPARPQQQQARQQGGRSSHSAQCNSAPEGSSEHNSLSRRAAIGGALALAAAASLQTPLPASARQVVSSDWEKVDLPVDPGVVLLDIGFTDDQHGAEEDLRT